MFCLYRFTYLSYQYGLFHQYKKRHTPAATESANYCFYETIPSLTLIITLASVDLKYNTKAKDMIWRKLQDYSMQCSWIL